MDRQLRAEPDAERGRLTTVAARQRRAALTNTEKRCISAPSLREISSRALLGEASP
jgi:hypothetical protein